MLKGFYARNGDGFLEEASSRQKEFIFIADQHFIQIIWSSSGLNGLFQTRKDSYSIFPIPDRLWHDGAESRMSHDPI